MNNKPPNEIPNASDWAKLKVYLSTWLTQQEINSAIGQTPNGRNRNVISTDLSIYLKTRQVS